MKPLELNEDEWSILSDVLNTLEIDDEEDDRYKDYQSLLNKVMEM
jgi:hypothetical protein